MSSALRVAAFAAAALGASACGVAPDASQSAPEHVQHSKQSVISGGYGGVDLSFNVPGGPVSPYSFSFENETSATQTFDQFGTLHEYVAYNASETGSMLYPLDSQNPAYEDRYVCQGASLMGYSRSVAGADSWTRNSVLTPIGWSLLWGDPAMTTLGNTVFLSNLASPDDMFQHAVNYDSDVGCIYFSHVPGSLYPATMDDVHVIGGACIARGTPPNPLTINSDTDCLRIGNDAFDGGSMAATASHVYAAYWDMSDLSAGSTGSAVVYQATETGPFTRMENGLETSSAHPLLTADATHLYIVGVSDQGLIVYRMFDETTQTWSGYLRLDQTAFDRSDVQVVGGPTLRTIGMSIAYVPAWNGSSAQVEIVAQAKDQNGLAYLTVSHCDAPITPTSACITEYNISFFNANFFQPTVVAYSSPTAGGAPLSAITYWTDLGDGTIQLQLVLNDLQGNGPTYFASQAQYPCVAGPNEWGDYDATWLRTDPNSPFPWVMRAVTDSTWQACDSRPYRAFAQHISTIQLRAY